MLFGLGLIFFILGGASIPKWPLLGTAVAGFGFYLCHLGGDRSADTFIGFIGFFGLIGMVVAIFLGSGTSAPNLQ